MLLLALLGGLPAALALVYVTWAQQYSFEVRWTLTTVVGARLDRRGRGRLPDGHARALPAGEPARRAARRGLLDPRHRREAGQRRRSGDAGDQRARRHAAAAAHRGGRIDRAPAERDGRDRRRGVRLRHGRASWCWSNPGRRAADRAAGAACCSDASAQRAAAGRLPHRRHAAADRAAVRAGERPPRAAPLDVPPRRQAAPAARLRRPEPRAARRRAAGLAAHRPRAVARDQQLADADQVDRAQHQADALARARSAARRRDPGRPEPDRDAFRLARPVPARLRAARAAAQAAGAQGADGAARPPDRRAREPAAGRR